MADLHYLAFEGGLRIEANSGPEGGMEIEVNGKDIGRAITETFMVPGEVKYVSRYARITVEVLD